MRADGRRLLRQFEAFGLERPLDRIKEARRRDRLAMDDLRGCVIFLKVECG